jgi:hypothetical protein
VRVVRGAIVEGKIKSDEEAKKKQPNVCGKSDPMYFARKFMSECECFAGMNILRISWTVMPLGSSQLFERHKFGTDKMHNVILTLQILILSHSFPSFHLD